MFSWFKYFNEGFYEKWKCKAARNFLAYANKSSVWYFQSWKGFHIHYFFNQLIVSFPSMIWENQRNFATQNILRLKFMSKRTILWQNPRNYLTFHWMLTIFLNKHLKLIQLLISNTSSLNFMCQSVKLNEHLILHFTISIINCLMFPSSQIAFRNIHREFLKRLSINLWFYSYFMSIYYENYS